MDVESDAIDLMTVMKVSSAFDSQSSSALGEILRHDDDISTDSITGIENAETNVSDDGQVLTCVHVTIPTDNGLRIRVTSKARTISINFSRFYINISFHLHLM